MEIKKWREREGGRLQWGGSMENFEKLFNEFS